MTTLNASIVEKAGALLRKAREVGLKITTAESCTGGLIAASLTEIAGSSDVFDRGFVTYSYASKTDLLGVPKDMVEADGAVSARVAQAMAEGALARSAADMAVAVTGIAGPGGGSDSKPVGLVWFAVATKTRGVFATERQFGDQERSAIREATVLTALDLLASEIEGG